MIPAALTDKETEIYNAWQQHLADGAEPIVAGATISYYSYTSSGVSGKIMRVCMEVDSVWWERTLIDGPSASLAAAWDLCI